MAKSTPEGKVKKKLIAFLKSLGSDCFYYMPVQNGMGQSGIPDVMAIIAGRTFGIECKATPKQHPTTLQAFQLSGIDSAGGYAFVVDDETVDDFIRVVSAWLAHAGGEGGSLSVHMSLGEYNRLTRWREKLTTMEFESGTCS